MTTILFRTLIIYTCLIVIMRLMGKRQIGQLEVSELITTLLLSEIATLPIENPDIPVLYAVIPVVTLLTFEVVMAVLLSRLPRFRRKIESSPSMLIRNGYLDQGELLRNRLSVEELIASLRQQGVGDPGEVAYAILEKNGQMSLILKEEHRPLTPADLSMTPERAGMMHLVVCDGVINEYNLKLLGRDGAWVSAQLQSRGLRQDEVLYLLCNDAGRISVLKKER